MHMMIASDTEKVLQMKQYDRLTLVKICEISVSSDLGL